MSQASFSTRPDALTEPVDDGACDHLAGLPLPAVALPSTQGGRVAFDTLPAGGGVIFRYPMTGQPGVALPDGLDENPGARGYTTIEHVFYPVFLPEFSAEPVIDGMRHH